MTEVLKREVRDGVLILTMSRPERRNALNSNLTLALREATAAAAEDSAVRAVLLTGAGGHFCVGGDVKAMNQAESASRPLGERIHELRDRMSAARYLHEMPKPTIAAIAGSAAGAGLGGLLPAPASRSRWPAIFVSVRAMRSSPLHSARSGSAVISAAPISSHKSSARPRRVSSICSRPSSPERRLPRSVW
jgi:hypothetical protein